MAQIRQYKKMKSPDAREPARRPTVRFRDLESTLRLNGKGQVPGSSTQLGGMSADRVELSESDSESSAWSSDSESESDDTGAAGDNSVTEGGFGWDTAQTQTRRAYQNEPSNRLVVEDIANLNSYTLRDLLSDEPLVTVPKPSQPLVTPVRTQPRTLRESDWSL
ncbi:hypothetical protein BDY19DRAFT_949555 [Irpex rosettiformis]|uniref:Uncharacterized protein n=1 Tax=Irpex rosettiformis TaxID=378272 RepID=A0ACB8U1Q3_9APHY|nr:hypothetical protein BDY19DRAFT_949555 [Irpex rosettiformis]